MSLVNKSIDIAISWIEDKNASYICKDDKVVWFASITGRPQDATWQSMSLSEVVRTIKYTKLSDNKLTNINVITAFQELGRVYEISTTSSLTTPSNVFNYGRHKPRNLEEELVKELAFVINDIGIKGILISDLDITFNTICMLTKIQVNSRYRNKLYREYFGDYNYVLRDSTNRVNYKGKKKTAILHRNYKPKNIRRFEKQYLKDLAVLIVDKVEK